MSIKYIVVKKVIYNNDYVILQGGKIWILKNYI